MEVGDSAVYVQPSTGYDLVGFIFTNRCNFSCRHCCNESDSHKVAALDTEEMFRCIDELTRCPGIREIGISGGEPFLFPGTLSSIARYAAERGFPTQVTSNCFWARSPQKATEVLGKLHAVGLRGLNISTSRYHFEFIQPERLLFAAQAAVDLGLVTRVNYVITRTFHLEDSKRLFGVLADELEFKAMPCIPAGRAAEQVEIGDFELRRELPLGSCERFFKSLAVDFNGDAYPCCSPGGFTEPLRLGNVRDQSVDDILAAVDRNLLIQVLRTLGPAYFAPFIVRRLGADALDSAFADQCHFCHTIMSDEGMRRIVNETVAQLKNDLSQLQWDFAALMEHASSGLRTGVEQHLVGATSRKGEGI